MSLKAIALGLLATSALVGGAVAQDEQIKIGVSIPAATHGFMGGLNWHAAEAEKRLEGLHSNIDLIIVTADGPEDQASDLEDLVSVQQIDALVVLPFESEPLTEPVRAVKETGAFITVVDRGLTDPSIQDVYVSGNNTEMGVNSAEYMMTRLGEGDNIVILRGIPTVLDTERFDAFMATIEGSGINVLDDEFANWNRDDGFKVMQDFLTRFPDIKGVWTQDDDISLGAIEAIKQAGREGEMFVVGGAGMQQILQRVQAGDALTPIDVSYSPAMIATAIELTTSHLVGGIHVNGRFVLESTLITQENAAEFLDADSPF